MRHGAKSEALVATEYEAYFPGSNHKLTWHGYNCDVLIGYGFTSNIVAGCVRFGRSPAERGAWEVSALPLSYTRVVARFLCFGGGANALPAVGRIGFALIDERMMES